MLGFLFSNFFLVENLRKKTVLHFVIISSGKTKFSMASCTIIIGDLCNTELDTIWFGQVFAKTSGLIFMKPFAHKNSFTSGENVVP